MLNFFQEFILGIAKSDWFVFHWQVGVWEYVVDYQIYKLSWVVHVHVVACLVDYIVTACWVGMVCNHLLASVLFEVRNPIIITIHKCNWNLKCLKSIRMAEGSAFAIEAKLKADEDCVLSCSRPHHYLIHVVSHNIDLLAILNILSTLHIISNRFQRLLLSSKSSKRKR